VTNGPQDPDALSYRRARGEWAADVAAFVLAGGQSSRMGHDKALLPFAGGTLVAHALSILREAGLPAMIAGARSPVLAEFAPVVADAAPGHGPLAGICAALALTAASRAIFLPVDLPLLPPSLLVFLLRRACITGQAVTVATLNGFAQTFPAVIQRPVLPILKAELDAGRNGCFSAFRATAVSLGQPLGVVPVEILAQSGHVAHQLALPPFRWFLNVNTPADFAQAGAIATRGIAYPV